MKFFHLSDLHIGLKFMNRDLREDQEAILAQIIHYAKEEQPDAIVIAGDIYDRSIPSAEAVEIFDHFISELVHNVPDTELMLISGNHDNAQRIDLYRNILQNQKIHMIGLPPQTEEEQIAKVVLKDCYGVVNFYLLPFVKPSMVKAIVGVNEDGNNLSYDATLHKLIGREPIDCTGRNVLVSHQFYLPVGKQAEDMERMDSESFRTVGNIDEVKSDILEQFDYVALGHIHKPMSVGSEFIRYCGTPFACSFSEAGQQKGIILVELGDKGQRSTQVLPLKPVREVRVLKGTIGEVLKESCEDYVRVVLTDREDPKLYDIQDRLYAAFPNLLEIRREAVEQNGRRRLIGQEEELDAFTLCQTFLNESDEAELELLRDVLNAVQEGEV